MKNACLICGEKLKYFTEDKMMECSICHKKESSKTQCINGHYVCNECHLKGLAGIISRCLRENSTNPVKILEKIMDMDFCHMHGPEHHIIVGAALLTAYKNAGGDIDLSKALLEMQSRGEKIPGGACGFWGACGAAISAGMYMSIATKATPMEIESWGLSNRLTSKVLGKIGELGGPRCCKRNSYIAVLEAAKISCDELGVTLSSQVPTCSRSWQNSECIKERCPFWQNK